MATGFKSGTVDLDDVFDPYVEGTKPALTGFKVGTQDLRDRFAPLAYGIQAAATGHKVGTADLNTLFAKKGTAVYAKLVDPPAYSGVTWYDTEWAGSGTAYAGIYFTIRADGTWYMSKRAMAGTASGNWWTPTTTGIGAGYSVRFTVTPLTGSPDITNPAATFVAVDVNRTLYVGVSAGFNSTDWATASVRVEIKKNSTGVVVLDDTFTVDVNAESAV